MTISPHFLSGRGPSRSWASSPPAAPLSSTTTAARRHEPPAANRRGEPGVRPGRRRRTVRSQSALPDHNRYYGMAFQAAAAPRRSGARPRRQPHGGSVPSFCAIHLFWLCGGFACFLLARRLFRSAAASRSLAMLLFLLHPHLYAHAFSNGKDIPFLSMFMIALHLVHRAFEKDTVRAFAVLGAAAAVLTNLRHHGRDCSSPPCWACGRWTCSMLRSGASVRRVLKTAAAFGAAGAATLYSISPYLWSDPRQFAEALRVLSEHPTLAGQLFQGRLVRPDDLPWRYVPTWMAITTPPFTLLLGCIGVGGVAWRVAARPGRALRNTPLRFGLLLTACLAAPPLAVAALARTPTAGGGTCISCTRRSACWRRPGCACWRRATPPGCAEGRMRRRASRRRAS